MAAPAEMTIEENNDAVPDEMGMDGEKFEVYESDSKDEQLEFVDSFVWIGDHFEKYYV